MADKCSHDCSSCGESCSSRDKKSLLKSPHQFSDIKKVIAVVSGKGGVGKSMTCALLAAAAQNMGRVTAVMDADITGPSVPKMFGVHERATGSENGILPVISEGGVQIMSMNVLLENEAEPVVWRGSLISGTVLQFWTDVIWTGVDIMFIDMPPGTGDVPLTVFQSIPIDGVIVVTTPQDLVGMIVEKAVNMAQMMNVPILGIVELYQMPRLRQKNFRIRRQLGRRACARARHTRGCKAAHRPRADKGGGRRQHRKPCKQPALRVFG